MKSQAMVMRVLDIGKNGGRCIMVDGMGQLSGRLLEVLLFHLKYVDEKWSALMRVDLPGAPTSRASRFQRA